MNKSTTIAIVLFTGVCSIFSVTSGGNNEPAPEHKTIDPVIIRFRSGLPGPDGRLIDGIDKESSEWALRWNLALLLDAGQFQVDIIGHTDDVECDGGECLILSVERATSVYAWYLEQGVSASSFRAITGYGSSLPLDPRTTEIGRANNRRVELSVVWPSVQAPN